MVYESMNRFISPQNLIKRFILSVKKNEKDSKNVTVPKDKINVTIGYTFIKLLVNIRS